MSLKENLIEALEIINKPCFLLGGASLWAYRNNEFTPKSFGIGIWGLDKNYQEELNKKLELSGWNVQRVIGSVIQAKKELNLMIFFLNKEGDEWYSYRVPVGRWLSIPDKFHNLEEIKFQGIKVKVPSPIESYLTWVYGNWKIPSNDSSKRPKRI